MAWTEKAYPSPFDTQPIDGLFFLSGDLLARTPTFKWAKGEKCPMIAFPSGLTFPLWEATDNEDVIVNLGHNVALPLHGTREFAFRYTVHLAEESGFWVRPIGEDVLGFVRRKTGVGLYAVYDNQEARLVDVERRPNRLAPW